MGREDLRLIVVSIKLIYINKLSYIDKVILGALRNDNEEWYKDEIYTL